MRRVFGFITCNVVLQITVVVVELLKKAKSLF